MSQGLRHAYRDLDGENAEAESHGAGGRGDSQLRAIFASMGKAPSLGATAAPAGRAAALTPSVKTSANRPPSVPKARAGHTPKVKAPSIAKAPKVPHQGAHKGGHVGHNPLTTAKHVVSSAAKVASGKGEMLKKTAKVAGEAALAVSGAGHKTASAIAQEGGEHHFGLTHS